MTLTVQLNTMLSMIAMGIWLGAAIDTYGRFTKERRSFHWLTAVNDFLFWFAQGLIVFFVLLNINEGEMRFYIILALICGYAAYRAIFQRKYQVLLEHIINFSIATYRFFRSVFIILIYKPIKTLLKLLYSLCMMLITSLITIILFLLKMLYKPTKWFTLFLYKLSRLDKLIAKAKRNRYIQKVIQVIKVLLKRKS